MNLQLFPYQFRNSHFVSSLNMQLITFKMEKKEHMHKSSSGESCVSIIISKYKENGGNTMSLIKEIAYTKYQVFWLFSHGITMKHINETAEKWHCFRLNNPGAEYSFSDYLNENEIEGRVWSSYDEFLGHEYEDRQYMRRILSYDEYRMYLVDIGDGYITLSNAHDLIKECIKFEILRKEKDGRVWYPKDDWFTEPKDLTAEELMYDKIGRDLLSEALEKVKAKRNTISDFRCRYRFLSNFYQCPILYDGITYQSAETAFQAQKSESRKRREDFSTLLPSEAKYLGRKVKLRPDWEEVKENIMKEIVQAKFTQNPELMEMLIQTKGKTLIEGNHWHDNIWGKCFCGKCRDKEGKNLLGKFLMEIRDAELEKRNQCLLREKLSGR